MARTIIGLFERWEDARDAVDELDAAGLAEGRISMIRGGSAGSGAGPHGAGEAALDGAGTGALSGAMIGTGVGLLAGLGALLIPGIGPVVAAGPIVAAVTGAGVGAAAGAVTGGLVGALTQVGVPEPEVGYFEEGVRRGDTLVIVACDEREVPLVADALKRHNGLHASSRVMEYTSAGDVERWTAADAYRYAPVETGGRLAPPQLDDVTPTTEDNIKPDQSDESSVEPAADTSGRRAA